MAWVLDDIKELLLILLGDNHIVVVNIFKVLIWISHGFTCVPHPEPPSMYGKNHKKKKKRKSLSDRWDEYDVWDFF